MVINIPVWDKATSHFLNQWWLVYWSIHASLGLNDLKRSHFKDISTIWNLYFNVKWVYGPKPRSSRGNTSSNPQVSAFIPPSAFNRNKKWLCHGSDSTLVSHGSPIFTVQAIYKLLHKHFIIFHGPRRFGKLYMRYGYCMCYLNKREWTIYTHIV